LDVQRHAAEGAFDGVDEDGAGVQVERISVVPRDSSEWKISIGEKAKGDAVGAMAAEPVAIVDGGGDAGEGGVAEEEVAVDGVDGAGRVARTGEGHPVALKD
jgi:hypothetical protein